MAQGSINIGSEHMTATEKDIGSGPTTDRWITRTGLTVSPANGVPSKTVQSCMKKKENGMTPSASTGTATFA